MTEKEIHESALLIGNEMNKFRTGNACNFGFITDDNQNFRVFSGGLAENIAYGIAVGIVNICALTGLGADYAQSIADKAIAILESNKGAQVQ